MSTRITLDTTQVLSIASQIDADNKELERLLQESKSTIDALGSNWTGKAAEETRTAYDSFANKYFQAYAGVLDQYVKFLRNNVAAAYEEVETANVQLSEMFK